ncbi:MAG: hypothetical protein Q8L92_05745 [Rubrivivax sp.]|nr:hypothetical protein [Rubrivivax sp.]
MRALASGNPLVIEKAGADAGVARLSRLYSVCRNQRYANECEVSRLPMMIEVQRRKVTLYAGDVARIGPQTLPGIYLEVGGRKIAGPDTVGEALRDFVKAYHGRTACEQPGDR